MGHFKTSGDWVNGLYVKDGRLVNDRFPSESGIAKAARIKRAVENDRKINQIAEGIQVAEDRKKFNELDF
jgi:exopolysaccharide biosynthesis protein